MNTDYTVASIQQLTKCYGSHYALEDVNLQLPKGEVIGLLGPNGSGKTTLIKILTGLLSPTSGDVYIKGQKPSAATKALVSYLPDRNFIDFRMTGEKIIDFFASFYADFDSQKAYKLLVALNIDPFVPLRKFSKGTQEKVQLIMVMSRNAQLYILDEPIAGVDPASRDYIIRTILDNRNPESSILISTHLIADVEPILDRAIFLQYGHIIINDSAESIRQNEGKSINDLFREVFRC